VVDVSGLLFDSRISSAACNTLQLDFLGDWCRRSCSGGRRRRDAALAKIRCLQNGGPGDTWVLRGTPAMSSWSSGGLFSSIYPENRAGIPFVHRFGVVERPRDLDAAFSSPLLVSG